MKVSYYFVYGNGTFFLNCGSGAGGACRAGRGGALTLKCDQKIAEVYSISVCREQLAHSSTCEVCK